MEDRNLTVDLPTCNPTTAAGQTTPPQARVRVEYRRPDGTHPEGMHLAAIRFGTSAARERDCVPASLQIDVRLDPLNYAQWVELWPARGAIRTDHEGAVRHASDDHHLIGVIECDEREHGGIRTASEFVYRQLRRFQQRSAYPHLLRIWNYFDAINAGDGDEERYRQFCIGRALGLGDAAQTQYPAASALGQQATTHRLQVYWLAARHPGVCLENPRQVSAYRYPRQYGPTPPSFARAIIVEDGTLLISGTASIVGHVSQHHGDPLAQLDETIRNLKALEEQARNADRRSAAANRGTLFKVYVRDPVHLQQIEARLQRVWPDSQLMFLAADICRSELLLEIEGVVPV